MANKYLDLVGLQTYHQALRDDYKIHKLPDILDATTAVATIKNTTLLNGDPTLPEGASGTLNNTNVLASTKWVYSQIQGVASAMVFKGEVTASDGSGSAITLTFNNLETTDTKVLQGSTFKFTANYPAETAVPTFKIGDILIANEDITISNKTVTYDALKWTLVPSGDDVDVTSVGISGVGLGTSETNDGPITSTGTINLKLDSQTALTGDTICNLGVNSSGNLAVKVPTAGSTLGLVKDGDRITIANDGTISADIATSSVAGAVSPDGTVITVDANGKITVPAATTSALGVVSVGNNINVSSGAISVNTGTSAQKGVLQVGTNLDVADGVVSVATATDSTKGVVQAGTNINIASGVISVATGATGTLGVVSPDGESITATNGVLSITDISTDEIDALFS